MIKVLLGETSRLLNNKINEYTSLMIEEKDDFNYAVYDFELTSLDEIIDCLECPSFSSPKKVVICKNPFFFSQEKVKTEFNSDYTKLLEYVEHENENSLLIICLPLKYFDKNNKFYTYFFKRNMVDNLTLDNKQDFIKYAKKILDEYKISMTNDAFNLFMDRVDSISLLETEVEKLSLCNKTIEFEDIKALISVPLEDDVFLLSNAILRKDHKQIMKLYNDLKLQKVQPIQIINILANQFRLLLEIAILDNQAKNDNEIASILNVNPYRVKKTHEVLYKYSISSIENILVELSDLDKEIKNGTKDRYIDFEIFLATK